MEIKSFIHTIKPLLPSVSYMHICTFSQNFDFNFRRDHKEISYENCDYKSVDEKSLSLARLYPEKQRKKIRPVED